MILCACGKEAIQEIRRNTRCRERSTKIVRNCDREAIQKEIKHIDKQITRPEKYKKRKPKRRVKK